MILNLSVRAKGLYLELEHGKKPQNDTKKSKNLKTLSLDVSCNPSVPSPQKNDACE
jgi:hypothetical protein